MPSVAGSVNRARREFAFFPNRFAIDQNPRARAVDGDDFAVVLAKKRAAVKRARGGDEFRVRIDQMRQRRFVRAQRRARITAQQFARRRRMIEMNMRDDNRR